MSLIERKEPDFIDLLEFFDPYEDTSDSEVVTEVSGPVIDDISVLKPGDVIHAYFPYLNANGGGKHRWGIIVWVDNQIKALGCFSIKDSEHRKKVLRYETNYAFPDWTNYGFTRESYAKATAVYPMERIHDIRIIGKVSDEIYKICMKKIGLVNRKMYSDPWSYLALLQRKNVMESIPSDGVSNNSNVLQTPHDIIENGSANCVDLALAVHVICLNSGLVHAVVKTTFAANEHKSTGHVYCIIKKGNRWHVFRYMPPTKSNGESISEIKQYMLPNLEAVIKAEERWLKPHHDRINGCNTTVESYVFSEDDIAFAEKCLAERLTQFYMLNGIFGPASLMKRIVKYEWGCVVKGKKVKDSLENWILNWRLLTPDQFGAAKCGCCWDYMAYEEWFFRENFQALLTTQSWYLETDPITYDASTNHTWLSYKRGNKVYAFEAAWKIYQGIREFNSDKEMIAWYLDKFYGGHDVEENYVVYTYHSKPGMDATKFSKNIYTKGNLVAKKGNHFTYRIKPIIEKDDWTNMKKMWG
ncbi:MAG: hypothetical protein J6O49_17045 [Bacteroidaceae bacterium]|nr:hypothetical protein [Bacteroidaceae bacterium]